MAQYSTEAILLSVRNIGEADKIVTFFSKDLGKVRAIAYGCRRPKSPLAGGMQVFSHLQLQVMAGSQLDTIKQYDTKTSFRQLRENLEGMAYASFLMELASEVCPERHPEPQIYEILLAALAAFSSRNPRVVALAAAFQLLECTGYQPNYFHCMICECKLEEEAFFSHSKGGAVCPSCAEGEIFEFPKEIRELITKLLFLNWQKPSKFMINGAALLKTEKLFLDYLMSFLEKPLKSLEFIQQLALISRKR